jgi:hypothetical protein
MQDAHFSNYVVTVPTYIDERNQVNLTPFVKINKMLGKAVSKAVLSYMN